MKFNEKLTDLRKKAGLSQEELGYKLNVTRQTVSKWELGQTTPEMDKLTELSKIFNITVDELTNDSELNVNQTTVIKDQPIDNRKVTSRNSIVIWIVIILIALLIIVIPITIFNNTRKSITNAAENILNSSENIQEDTEGFFDSFFNIFRQATDMQEDFMESHSEMSETFNVSSFNNHLQIYNGTKTGTSVKYLLDQIITSNKTKDRQITVKYLDIETQNTDELKNLKNKINDSNNFEVSFEYDDNGYITTAIIERTITQFEISRFNSSLELYSGSSMGGSVISVLDKIITSNKTSDRTITVKYCAIESQDETQIRIIKQNIDTFDNCEIIYEYDADGFICKAIIEKH